MRVLVTGATGKVGQAFIARFLAEPRFASADLVALCHNRTIPETDRVRVVRGSIADPATIHAALEGVTHVIHMATVKEAPFTAMDVSVKGMFLLLEVFRAAPSADQFMLIGGDCVVGHCFVPYDGPITEASPRRAYPGVYALANPVASQQLFNIAMTQPVDYGEVAQHLQRTRGMAPVEIASNFHSNHIDNAKARFLLGWLPKVDATALCDLAFAYERAADDPRKVGTTASDGGGRWNSWRRRAG